MKDIVWRLLKRNISAGQLIGYAVANFVGLSIVLTAIQFYRDVTAVWNGCTLYASPSPRDRTRARMLFSA